MVDRPFNKKIVGEIITDTDIGTGEITTKVRERVLHSEPDFVKLYLKDLRSLYSLPNAAGNLLQEMAIRMSYDGAIHLNATNKEEIRVLLKTTIASMDTTLSRMVKKGVLCKKGRGSYMLNPHLFAKGKWNDVRKLREEFDSLTLTITYDKRGRTIIGG